MSGAWNAIVLAAGRGPRDPLAKAFGVSHKCLIPIGGTPMLRRVVEALRQHPAISTIVVSIEQPGVLAEALGERAPEVVAVASLDSAPASALAALNGTGLDFPVLLTTGDHALLDTAMLDHFLGQSEAADADLTIGLAAAETILARYPDARRTFLSFGRERVSGCNLYGLRTRKSLAAVELWRGLDRVRKRPWRIVRAFGTQALLRYLTGRLSLDEALALASERLGLRARAVLMPFAETAIDVDKPEDKELAERIVAMQANLGE